jgi:hypothetical protein
LFVEGKKAAITDKPGSQPAIKQTTNKGANAKKKSALKKVQTV